MKTFEEVDGFCYLVIDIENLLRPLQLFYFHLWLIYWLSLVISHITLIEFSTNNKLMFEKYAGFQINLRTGMEMKQFLILWVSYDPQIIRYYNQWQ
jgi:hypothetical protein